MKKLFDKPIEDRLQVWIKDDHYLSIENSQLVVEEKKDDGLALVRCTLPNGRAFELTLEGKNIAHLKIPRCTDGILLLETPSGEWELHIIECKRTVNRSKWKRVKMQFEASIQRSIGLLAGIGVFPHKIKLYTAVREQKIIDEKNADPVLNKMTLEQWRQLSDEEQEKLHYMDWFGNSIDIWVQRDVPHEIIPLDDNGTGSVTIQWIP